MLFAYIIKNSKGWLWAGDSLVMTYDQNQDLLQMMQNLGKPPLVCAN